MTLSNDVSVPFLPTATVVLRCFLESTLPVQLGRLLSHQKHSPQHVLFVRLQVENLNSREFSPLTPPLIPPMSSYLHADSSAYVLSSSSDGIPGVHWSSTTRMTRSMTRMTRMVGSSEGPQIRHIVSLNELLEPPVRGKIQLKSTIEMLPDDALLEIFDFYRLDAMKQFLPWKWHRLAHVCRRWRHVISMSPLRLDLQIVCRSGASIESILDSWPNLPLVLRFDWGEVSNPLPRNIIAALRHPDRLCEIDLRVTSSMAGPIVEAIQKPCQALENVWITVKGQPLIVRNTFLGGSAPHLRNIKLAGISVPFPELRQVLLSTNNLVDLHLSKIPNSVCFSPDELVTGLSTLFQLKWLAVGFDYPASSLPSTRRPPRRRTSLPSLTFFDFYGASKYLEAFVARIDLPALCKFKIELFNGIFFEIPQLCHFISYLDKLGTPARVIVTHSAKSVSVRFVSKEKPSKEKLSWGTSSRLLDRQLSFVTQISSQLLPLLSSVQSLTIKKGYGFPTGEEAVDSTRWLELFRPFTQVAQVSVSEERLVLGIVEALAMEDVATGVLPELTSLHLTGYRSSPPVVKAAQEFVATCRLSGRTVSLSD